MKAIIRKLILACVLIGLVAGLAVLGYRYWYQPTYDFLSSDDALVTGSLVRIAAPASGQVSDLFVDTGDVVKKGDALATVKVVSSAPASVGLPSVPRVLTRVTSPVSGTIAARNVSVGDTVAAGQVIATVVDQNSLWVVLNVIETRVTELKPGMIADVRLPSVNQTFRGTVTEIGSATTEVTAASSPLSISTTSDSDKKVPVKILFDYTGYRLVPGLSANIIVYTHLAPR